MKKFVILFVITFAIGFIYAEKFFYPTVSVVMPTYNREKLLPRAIDSILAQTYKDFELIIVDDGSTDNTMELLNAYAKKDARIKIIHYSKNRGISYARNQGNKLARGKYIAIMDDDDTSLPTRLEKQVAYMDEHPDIAAATCQKKLDSGVIWRYTTDPEDFLFGMHFANLMGNPETIMRRNFLVKNNIRYNEKISAEDYDFFKQIIFAGGKLAIQPEFLLLYRFHREHGEEEYLRRENIRQKISKEFFKKYNIEWSGDKTPTCDLIREMIKNNHQVGWLTDEFLQKKEREICSARQKH